MAVDPLSNILAIIIMVAIVVIAFYLLRSLLPFIITGLLIWGMYQMFPALVEHAFVAFLIICFFISVLSTTVAKKGS